LARLRGIVLQRFQAALEIAGFDCPHEGSDHLSQRLGLAGGQVPACDRGSHRAHRAGDVGGAAERRQRELHGTLAPRREDAFEAELERGRIAAIGELHGAAGEPVGLAVEQRRGRKAR
jgi:hypothetical protein